MLEDIKKLANQCYRNVKKIQAKKKCKKILKTYEKRGINSIMLEYGRDLMGFKIIVYEVDMNLVYNNGFHGKYMTI